MGCNGLFLWEGMVKPPTFYTMIDHPAMGFWAKDIEALDTCRIAGLRSDWPTDMPKWYVVDQRRDWPLSAGNFNGQDDDFTWCAGRANVIWSLSTQLAFWMGFDPVYILGVDGTPENGKRLHCYEVKDFILGKIEETKSDFNARTILSTRKSIPVVMDAYRRAGRSLINLNPDTFTRGIPTMTLKEALYPLDGER